MAQDPVARAARSRRRLAPAGVLLGRSPGECRRGQHPQIWRKDADEQLSSYRSLPGDSRRDGQDIERLAALPFAFSHLNDGGQR